MAQVPSLPRRVLLGMGGSDDIRATIAAAAEFAGAVRSELLCLLVEREDLINAAGLPFARAYGFGGSSAARCNRCRIISTAWRGRRKGAPRSLHARQCDLAIAAAAG
jgi:hypothetical protein